MMILPRNKDNSIDWDLLALLVEDNPHNNVRNLKAVYNAGIDDATLKAQSNAELYSAYASQPHRVHPQMELMRDRSATCNELARLIQELRVKELCT